jgi:acyl dehydratase
MAAPLTGARMERDLLLDAEAIRAGARLVGDMNPLHHDEAFAARSRFGELIASGAHTSALLAGMLSNGFGNEADDGRPMVGVDYSVQFRGPVRVGRRMRMEWLVFAHETRRSGVLVRLRGGIVDVETAATALSAEMTVLHFT